MEGRKDVLRGNQQQSYMHGYYLGPAWGTDVSLVFQQLGNTKPTCECGSLLQHVLGTKVPLTKVPRFGPPLV